MPLGNAYTVIFSQKDTNQTITYTLTSGFGLSVNSLYYSNSNNRLYVLTKLAKMYSLDTNSTSLSSIAIAATASTGNNIPNNPLGIYAINDNNIYLADNGKSVILKINNSQQYTSTKFAGLYDDSSTTKTTTIPTPIFITKDSSGNFYTTGSLELILRKITSSGTVSKSYNIDNMSCPIVCDSNNNIFYVYSAGSIIRKIDTSGNTTTFAGLSNTSGFIDDTGSNARFSNIMHGICVDSNDNLYVSDSGNNAIRKITSSGVVTTVAKGRKTVGKVGQLTVGKYHNNSALFYNRYLPNSLDTENSIRYILL